MRAELDGAAFDMARRGYDREQVDERIATLDEQLVAATERHEAAEADLRETARKLEASRGEIQAVEKARVEARNEVARLSGHVAELSTIPSTVDGMSERLQQMVRIAQDDVNDMRSRATASATQILTMAQAEAEELQERSNAERKAFEAERQAAEEEVRSELSESRARLEQARDESEGQRAHLDAELAERRQLAMKELETELEQGREAVRAELAGQRFRQREEAARIIDAANAEARTNIGEASVEAERLRVGSRDDIQAARRHLDELRALQNQVSEQLTSVRALLDWTLPQMTTQQAASQPDQPGTRPEPVAAGTGSAGGPPTGDRREHGEAVGVPAQAPAVDQGRHSVAPVRTPSPALRGPAPAPHRAGSPR